ncbi:hypothetical protein [Phreatobacter stygius]|uniref:DUF4148 domain-containing protein n=1 Tax=Phreatobacter stygius TaxID=1940610 RepID=A0A4D7B313_9HYPH|nr:hypothetical protein [Phreatobacter stygius]QCI68129.1 hypothetical protein E8M01_30195 [Phreatobacter stygius]
MKKLILAATLVAPLAVAAPAFAQQDAAGFIETPSVTTYAPNQPREFSARAGRVSQADQSLIKREAVPSSAFSSWN